MRGAPRCAPSGRLLATAARSSLQTRRRSPASCLSAGPRRHCAAASQGSQRSWRTRSLTCTTGGAPPLPASALATHADASIPASTSGARCCATRLSMRPTCRPPAYAASALRSDRSSWSRLIATSSPGASLGACRRPLPIPTTRAGSPTTSSRRRHPLSSGLACMRRAARAVSAASFGSIPYPARDSTPMSAIIRVSSRGVDGRRRSHIRIASGLDEMPSLMAQMCSGAGTPCRGSAQDSCPGPSLTGLT